MFVQRLTAIPSWFYHASGPQYTGQTVAVGEDIVLSCGEDEAAVVTEAEATGKPFIIVRVRFAPHKD